MGKKAKHTHTMKIRELPPKMVILASTDKKPAPTLEEEVDDSTVDHVMMPSSSRVEAPILRTDTSHLTQFDEGSADAREEHHPEERTAVSYGPRSATSYESATAANQAARAYHDPMAEAGERVGQRTAPGLQTDTSRLGLSRTDQPFGNSGFTGQDRPDEPAYVGQEEQQADRIKRRRSLF